jgi:hypothetical protein
MEMVRGAALGVLLCSTSWAGPKSLAVAAGDCRDADLLNAATAFSDAVAWQLKADALDAAEVLERLRPRPIGGLDEAQRQIDTAQSQFYAGQLDKALEVVRSALKSLERAPPSEGAFKQLAAGRVLEGLVLKGQGKKSDQVEAWKRVLRVKPDFALDADYYTPATLLQFDQLRKDLSKTKRVALSVVSQPAGATVFIDGASVGKTPFSGAFPAGAYRLTLMQGEAQSFVYEVSLDQPQELQVDLALEASLKPQLPLCVNGPAGEVDGALKLAARAGAERALVLRVESRNNEPGWVAAVLLEVKKGARVREGGMKLAAAQKGQGFVDLASFVLTGQPAKLSLDHWAAAAQEPSPTQTSSVAATAEPKPAPEAEVSVEGEVEAPSGGNGPRIASIVTMGAGAAAAITGLVVYLAGGVDRAALADHLTPTGELKSAADADAAKFLEQKISTNRGASLGLVIGGGVALAAGAALFFLLPPKEGPAVSAGLMPGGGFVAVSGRLP